MNTPDTITTIPEQSAMDRQTGQEEQLQSAAEMAALFRECCMHADFGNIPVGLKRALVELGGVLRTLTPDEHIGERISIYGGRLNDTLAGKQTNSSPEADPNTPNDHVDLDPDPVALAEEALALALPGTSAPTTAGAPETVAPDTSSYSGNNRLWQPQRRVL